MGREKIDALVFDTYQPSLELAALHLKIPYIHVSNAVHFDTSGATPLCFFDWPNEDTSEARARNLEGVARFRKLLEPSVAAAKAYAAEVDLAVDWNDPQLLSRSWPGSRKLRRSLISVAPSGRRNSGIRDRFRMA